MTTCGPTLVPAAMLTCAPITAYGPTSTDGSRRAPASMIALGWMFPMDSGRFAGIVGIAHGAHQIGFDRQLTIDACRRLVFPDAACATGDLNHHLQLIARLD